MAVMWLCLTPLPGLGQEIKKEGRKEGKRRDGEGEVGGRRCLKKKKAERGEGDSEDTSASCCTARRRPDVDVKIWEGMGEG